MMSGPGGTGAAIGAVSGEMVKLSLKANEARASESLTSRIATLETLLEKRGVDADAGSDQATLMIPAPRQGDCHQHLRPHE